jgi:hypothetical protein
MKLADVRRRLVEEELATWAEARRRTAVVAAVAVLLLGFFVWYVMEPAVGWAKGEFFRPGGWGHDVLGFAGAVLFVRGVLVFVEVVLLAWVVASLYAITAHGLSRRRRRIERHQPRLRLDAEANGPVQDGARRGTA